MRIDAHQHFWNYDPAKHSWMNDEMGILKTDFYPTDLKPLLKNCKIDGCVAVQANQAEVENDFLLDLAAQNDFIKGIVGWVDLRAENVSDRLEYYTQFSEIKGFRHVLHDEPDLDFMLRMPFLNGIAQLNQFGYTYDLLIFPEHLSNATRLVDIFPNQPFVIDHIAKPAIRKEEIKNWQNDLKSIAKRENVFCKISGMVTEAQWKNWQKNDFKQYLDSVINAFGINRVMYGSDWPVCTLSASYQEQFEIVEDYFSAFSTTEQANFFGNTTTQFYNL